MSIPPPRIPVPAAMADLIASRRHEVVWINGRGGLTAQIDDPAGGTLFLKYGPHNLEESMAAEADRLAWARPHARGAIAVPEVVGHGSDATHEWLLTRSLPGLSAVAPTWIERPETAVRAVGRGLRLLHDAFAVGDCPWTWSVGSRIDNAARRGIDVPRRLRTPPEVDRLVVCHGDPCCPNTLLDAEGAPVGHVDLGALGVADRWADIAVAALSTEWNYGPGWQEPLVEAYGVEYDSERMGFYQDLWNAT